MHPFVWQRQESDLGMGKYEEGTTRADDVLVLSTGAGVCN